MGNQVILILLQIDVLLHDFQLKGAYVALLSILFRSPLLVLLGPSAGIDSAGIAYSDEP